MRTLLRAVAAALVVVAAACTTSAGAKVVSTTLTGSEWRLAVEQSGEEQLFSVPTVRFNDDGRLGGDAGCNSFFGAWELEGSRLRIGELATTKKLCQPPAVMKREAAFLAALQDGGDVTTEDGELVISDREGNVLLRLVPVAR